MKFLLCSLFLLFALWTGIDARVIEHSELKVHGANSVVNLTVLSASLPTAANASVNIYVHDSVYALQLPITPSELKNIIYAELSVDSRQKNSKNPTFNVSLAPGPPYFSDDSFFAIEIWTKLSESFSQYIAGTEFQISQLKTFPHKGQLPLVDESGGTAGILEIEWN